MDRLEKLLREAPGPAPWYWQSFPPFENSRESWSWRLEPTGGEIVEWPTLQRESERDGSPCSQQWFTAATHDLGYEWVTKVARDRVSARIVGAGIRVPAFELEDDGTTVRRWLTDPWGQPIAAERRDRSDA